MFQHPREVYAVLSELEDRPEDERDQLLSRIDAYADDIPTPTDTDDVLSAEDVAEGIYDFTGDIAPMLEMFEPGEAQEILSGQVAVLLGDRLRYMPESGHYK